MRINAAGLPLARRRSGWAILAAVLAVVLPGGAKADNNWPDKVTAQYKVTFNGFDIGDFRFESSVQSRAYSLAGSAKLSLLLGAYKWSGTTRSKGVIGDGDPKPVEHSFAYEGGSKTGSVAMSFSQGRVADRKIEPPSSPSRRTVPLKDEHLVGVFDPLSAVMAMSRGKVDKPCDQKIPIFDGKQRFDIELSFKRQERVTEKRPSGQPGLAYVCSVRYIPVAGHKNNNKMIASIAENMGIEVVLRPIPSANILVPYKVTVPTFAGSAVLTSQRVEITTGVEQIALVH